MGVYEFEAETLDGRPAALSDYRGKVLLIVNTASKCGLTPQYEGLEALYRKHKDQGFAVLGFPCNQFGAQEPGDAGEIASFCSLTYDVSFPMMSKLSVKGDDQTPLYQFLTSKSADPKFGGEIKWNFTKFLVDRKGNVVQRFESKITPDSPEVTSAIEKQLKQN